MKKESTKPKTTTKPKTDANTVLAAGLEVGMTVRKGRSKFLVCKVLKNKVRLRQFWDRAIPRTNRRNLRLGDFYEADISEVRDCH